MPSSLGRGELGVLALLAVPGLVLAFIPDARELFGWEAGRAGEEPWRYVSGHFVHLGNGHLAANLGALALLCWTSAQLGGRAAGTADRAARSTAIVEVLAGSWLGATLGLAGGLWPIDWYVGLSGLLYGLFAGLALHVTLYHPRWRWLGVVLMVGALARIVLDVQAGVGALGALGIPVAAPVHLYGYLGGLCATALRAVVARRRIA